MMLGLTRRRTAQAEQRTTTSEHWGLNFRSETHQQGLRCPTCPASQLDPTFVLAANRGGWYSRAHSTVSLELVHADGLARSAIANLNSSPPPANMQPLMVCCMPTCLTIMACESVSMSNSVDDASRPSLESNDPSSGRVPPHSRQTCTASLSSLAGLSKHLTMVYAASAPVSRRLN